MRVVAINGSARKDGNTSRLVEAVFEPLRAVGHQCEQIQLAARKVQGCTACRACYKHQDRQCHGRDDFGNEVIAALADADAIILASPVYFADVSAEMKAVIDRAGYVARANGNMFARRPAASLAAVRRAGAIHTLDTMNHLFLIGEMVVVGSSYWNLGVGGGVGEVESDAEGLGTMKRLGENMAWLLGKLGS